MGKIKYTADGGLAKIVTNVGLLLGTGMVTCHCVRLFVANSGHCTAVNSASPILLVLEAPSKSTGRVSLSPITSHTSRGVRLLASRACLFGLRVAGVSGRRSRRA